MTERDAVPLVQAAQELKQGYFQTRDAVLRGELAGFQQCGRWFVERGAIERARLQRATAATEGD